MRQDTYSGLDTEIDTSTDLKRYFTFLRARFAAGMRKIISLIKAKRNEGLEQLEILTARSRRDGVFMLKLILLFQQANARETWDDEFIIHSIGGVP